MRIARMPRQVLLLLLAALAGAGLPAATGVHAAPQEVCAPTPKTAASFCVTSDVTINAAAARPVQLGLTFSNTSDGHGTDKSTWLETATVSLTPTSAGPFAIKPSAQLPHGLVIAGGGSCTSPDFTDCAGHGTAYVDIQGTFDDGMRLGTFGVERITNVNPPSAGAHAEYLVVTTTCVPALGSDCAAQVAGEYTLTVPDTAGPPPLTFTLPLRFSGGTMGGTYDAAIDTMTLAVSGTSSAVWNGSTTEPVSTVRVLSTPARCGTVVSSIVAATGEGTPRVVEAPADLKIRKCPVASFTVAPGGFTAAFDGAMSAAATGREVRRWLWDFGDGTTKTTAVPTVSHRYRTYGNHVATLQVVDSVGARSATINRTVRGTTTTVAVSKVPGEVTAAGAVTPKHAGQRVTVVLDRKIDGAFKAVAKKRPTLSGASRYTATFARRPAGQCRFRVTFPGDSDHLGSRAAKGFAC